MIKTIFMLRVRPEYITNQIGTILSKSGGTRIVYNHKTDPELVIKEARHDAPFVNIIEYTMYEECPSNYKTWLAEPVAISFDGKYMIMQRTYPILPHELPSQVPYFIRDLHLANWGKIDGNPVCHDYSRFSLSTKMQDAKFDLVEDNADYTKEYYEGYQAVKEIYESREVLEPL